MKTDNDRLSQVSKFYDKETNNYDDGYSTAVCKAEDMLVADYLSLVIQGKVLDIGSGSGLLCEMLNIPDYHGIELSPKMTKLAKLKFPEKNFSIADMHSLPFDNESFDTVVSLYGPISYSLTPFELKNEIQRVLKPGGWVALMPYTLRVGHGLEMGGYSTALEPGIEKIFYKQEDLETLLAGFEDINIFGINFFLNTYVRFLEEMGGSNSSKDQFLEILKSEQEMNNILPAEYARHMIGFARKPL